MGAISVLLFSLCLLGAFVGLAMVGLLPGPLLSLYAFIQHFRKKKGKFAPKKKQVFNFNEVVHGVFVGTQPRNIKDLRTLKDACGVTAIVCLNEERELYVGSKSKDMMSMDFVRLHIPVPDYQGPSASQLRQAVLFIHQVLNHDGKVFIHCNGGKGRSAAVCVAYLIAQDTINNRIFKDYKEAVKKVKERRKQTSKSVTRYPYSSQSRNLVEFFKQNKLNSVLESDGLKTYVKENAALIDHMRKQMKSVMENATKAESTEKVDDNLSAADVPVPVGMIHRSPVKVDI